MTQILDSEFWISQWQQAADGSRFHEVYPDEKCIWNISARTFDSGLGKSDVRERTLLKILDNLSFWTGSNKRALDIGSGTGALSIPLALHGALVDALDNSEQMNNVLQEKCDANGIGNINILPEDFLQCDIPKNSYDLVLGSMNPCLYNPKSFLKMLSLSRDVLIYIGIAGIVNTSTEKPLAELITGISPGHNGSNHVIYPFNLLLSLGHCPTINYIPNSWERKEPPKQATLRLVSQHEHFRARYPDMDKVVRNYVVQHTKDGLYVEHGSALMGIVSCRKQEL